MRMRKKKHCGERMEKCAALWVKEPEKLKGKWNDEFANDAPIHIEIGCGKGDFVVGMARMHPDINYVAIERVEDVLVIAMEKAFAAGLENVRFVDINAEFLADFFEKGELCRIYLNFSDPWRKKKHAKRRLTHKRFIDIYKSVLNKGDRICFKTDNKMLFEFSLNELCAEDMKLSNITLDLHASDFEGNVMTEYERRFSEMGMPIYRLEAEYV